MDCLPIGCNSYFGNGSVLSTFESIIKDVQIFQLSNTHAIDVGLCHRKQVHEVYVNPPLSYHVIGDVCLYIGTIPSTEQSMLWVIMRQIKQHFKSYANVRKELLMQS